MARIVASQNALGTIQTPLGLRWNQKHEEYRRSEEVRGFMQHRTLCTCVCQQLKLMKNYNSKSIGQVNNLTGL